LKYKSQIKKKVLQLSIGKEGVNDLIKMLNNFLINNNKNLVRETIHKFKINA